MYFSDITVGIDSYEEEYGEKAVKENLTFPASLNTFAEIILISLNFYRMPYFQWHRKID